MTTKKTTKKTAKTAAKKAPAKKTTAKKKTATKKVTKPAAKKASGTASKPSASAAKERYERVAKAAYYIAERRGFQGVHDFEDWLEAERQVAKQESKKS